MSPSKNRVDKKLFEEVFKKGKILKGKYFLLRFFRIGKDQKKFTFVVPSSVLKSAAKRNLFKRRGKYVLNLNKNKINSGIAMIFIFNKDSLKAKFEEIKEDILSLICRVK
ncbi:MAG: hypothetical protein Athens071416_231 [Parcubacteria group bacterium Athens0714_16]|nr:MAG: hypothetical protein Athens071416_231 [Parcubacteria group bacterium Athens0714_16]